MWKETVANETKSTKSHSTRQGHMRLPMVEKVRLIWQSAQGITLLVVLGYAWYLPFLPWRSKCVCGGRDMYVSMHAHARSQTQLLFCRSYLPLLFFLKAGSGSLIEFWGLLANLPGGIPSPGITSTYHLSWNRQVSARDWTQDLMLAWQALHQLSHLPSPCSALSDCLEVVELKRKNPQWQ